MCKSNYFEIRKIIVCVNVIAAETNADKIMVNTQIYDHQAHLHSYEIIAKSRFMDRV